MWIFLGENKINCEKGSIMKSYKLNCTATVGCLLFPVLPIFGIFFSLTFFSIGIYNYNYPDIEQLGLCV